MWKMHAFNSEQQLGMQSSREFPVRRDVDASRGISRKDSTNTRGLAYFFLVCPSSKEASFVRVHMSTLWTSVEKRKRTRGRTRGCEEEDRRAGGAPFAFLLALCSCREKLLRVGSEKLLCLTNRRPFPLNRTIPVTLSRLANPFPLYPSRCHFDATSPPSAQLFAVFSAGRKCLLRSGQLLDLYHLDVRRHRYELGSLVTWSS